MECKVSDIYRILDEIAPFDTQMDFDNAGLLLGDPEAPVRCILTALDLTSGVAEEARRVGAQLLVTHHPVFFRPVKRLVETDPEARNVCALIRGNVAMIAAHTNFDMAEGGVNDAQVLLTGEVKHHEALDAMERGLCVLEAGHFFTEFCAARQLQKHLQERCDALQYNVKVLASDVHPFA